MATHPREPGAARPPNSEPVANAADQPARVAATAALAAALATLRATPWAAEAAGAVGDLGTFLPLTLGLVRSAGLDLGTTLIGTGIYNLVSGALFGIPVPVQPMKTIAAVAIAAAPGPAGLPSIMAAGMFVSSVVLFLGASRLVDAVTLLIPPSVIRGLQLGVGLKLAASGLKQGLLLPSPPKTGGGGRAASLVWRPVMGRDGLLAGVAALAFVLVTTMPGPSAHPADAAAARAAAAQRAHWRGRVLRWVAPRRAAARAVSAPEIEKGAASPGAPAPPPPLPPPCCSADGRPLPSALILVVIGLVVTLATAPPGSLAGVRLGPARPAIIVPGRQAWVAGITTAGGAAQLPLTALNSVIAVSALADALYAGARPASAWRWRPSLVALAVGGMNLAGAWFGVMPSCHGAGGLAAQHKMGGRTGVAPMLLGAVKLGVGLLFGSSLASVLDAFPSTVLGALLALAGAELACSARAEAGPRGFSLCALTAAAILATDDTAVGFLVGWAAWVACVVWEAGVRVVGRAAAQWRGRRAAAAAACEVRV